MYDNLDDLVSYIARASLTRLGSPPLAVSRSERERSELGAVFKFCSETNAASTGNSANFFIILL